MSLSPEREKAIRYWLDKPLNIKLNTAEVATELLAEIDRLRIINVQSKKTILDLMRLASFGNSSSLENWTTHDESIDALLEANHKLRENLKVAVECLDWYSKQKIEIPKSDGHIVFDWGTIAQKALAKIKGEKC